MRKVKPTRLSRALGVALTPKAARHLEKRSHPPGQHGKNKRPSQSTFAKQLLEKQRLKAHYNITERHLKNYIHRAVASKGVTGTELLRMLEARLDTVILRGGFTTTIYAARQIVSHGHITVDGRKVDTPGYQVKVGQLVSVRTKSKSHPVIQANVKNAVRPGFVDCNPDALTIVLTRQPERAEIPVICEEQKIVEYFAR